ITSHGRPGDWPASRHEAEETPTGRPAGTRPRKRRLAGQPARGRGNADWPASRHEAEETPTGRPAGTRPRKRRLAGQPAATESPRSFHTPAAAGPRGHHRRGTRWRPMGGIVVRVLAAGGCAALVWLLIALGLDRSTG